MAQPVWVLSVDLQTKTATFQSGLADAARSARGAFTDIKSGSQDMGRSMGTNMFEARHGVMLLGDELGFKLPRALPAFVTSIGPVGAAMEAAFPFLAIAVGATLLIEHLLTLQAEGQKLTEDQIKFGTATQTAFNQLDDKILQAGIRADDLRNNHLGALTKQLELIDHQSMAELVHAFDEVAKAADVVFGELKTSWYQIGIGSDGAKHALEQFQTQYSSLLAQGKDKDASDLLGGTLKSAQKVLEMQKQAKDNTGGLVTGPKENADIGAAIRAEVELKKSGVGWTEKEIAAQTTLVQALTAQLGVEQRVADLKKLDSGNATRQVANTESAQRSAAQRQAAESQLRMGESAVAADRAAADEQLTVKRASIEERLALDLEFADREKQLHLAANQAEIAALDKSSKDYSNQLKAANEKNLEIEQQYQSSVSQLKTKAAAETAAKELRDLEQSEREKIGNTLEGAAARIAAIDSAMKEEQSKGLQDTNFYRELMTQRVETVRQEAEEEAKLREESGREAAENAQKMGELAVSAERQSNALADSARRMTDERRMQEDLQIANEEYDIKKQAFEREAAALDKSGKDYENKHKALQDKEKQLVQQHENEITAIKEKAEEERNARILSAERQAMGEIASGLSKSIMGHQTWAGMVTSFGAQAAEGLIRNSLLILMQQDKEKLGDARKAATSAYATGESMGGPAGIVLGPVFAAAAFAGVMAFESGGLVPGVGRGDIVPAMLTPGESVLPKELTASLVSAARSGNSGTGTTVHFHHRPTYHVQTIDGDGIGAVLEKHSDEFMQHVNRQLRRMNR
jgi:hypothetical protein